MDNRGINKMDFSSFGGSATTPNQPISLNLTKGQTLNLTKTAPSLRKVKLGLGWDIAVTGTNFDLDASAFVLRNGKLVNNSDVVFYNNPSGQGITYGGDNRTGAGEGDDETISVDLSALPSDVDKIVFVATIYNAQQNQQTFGMVKNSYIRLVDEVSNNEIARYELKEDFSTETAVIFGQLEKDSAQSWHFHTLGEGKVGDLGSLAMLFA